MGDLWKLRSRTVAGLVVLGALVPAAPASGHVAGSGRVVHRRRGTDAASLPPAVERWSSR